MLSGVILVLMQKKIGYWIITLVACGFIIFDLINFIGSVKLVRSSAIELNEKILETTLPANMNYIIIAEITLFLLFILLILLSNRINNMSPESGTMKDPRDGKVYRVVKIGKQIVMAENLAYKLDDSCWAYDNKNDNVKTYGYLYDQSRARIVAHGIKGWHLPTKKEWQKLIDHLGGEDVAGGKMKDVETKLWNSPNKGATNESGFTALPAGFFGATSGYYKLGEHANFWSRTFFGGPDRCWKCTLNHKESKAIINFDEYYYGYSVRLFKNRLF
ncbi:MAG: hypothetical protein JXB49_26180 [Bacteroidales bacterium]|nr:hypothetical protein [Bacteroidales bacterium]